MRILRYLSHCSYEGDMPGGGLDAENLLFGHRGPGLQSFGFLLLGLLEITCVGDARGYSGEFHGTDHRRCGRHRQPTG
ncbi:hypothetical protein TNCV_4435031 [Trichonephila clavipes]|nr:hypothetical protein TNCV_4435031 [Trichonephila clavipes]